MGPSGGAGRRGWRALAVVLAVLVWPLGSAVAQPAPPLPREAIEQIIREYLLRHPEVIVESIRGMQAREREAQRQRARDVIVARRAELVADAAAPAAGNPDGDVTVVEFFDYRCPHCRRATETLRELLASDGGIRIVYKEFPILGEESVLATRVALAAHGQGAYGKVHDLLMGATAFGREDLLVLAAGAGLDRERLERDMEAPAITEAIQRNRALATALGIDGTPAFVAGGELVVGAVGLAEMRALVKQARERARP